MKNIDSNTHVRGESIYVDDVSIIDGTVYGYVIYSTIAHGEIVKLDFSEAMNHPDVIRIITAADIPGKNIIGRIIPDEELLATKEIHFYGQPIALILAKSELMARNAAKSVKVEYEELVPIVDPREAYDKNMIIGRQRTFKIGDVDTTWDSCDLILEGTVSTGAQEHLYIEGQGAYAYPTENNTFVIISSTQGPTAVQTSAADILGIPMNAIEVDVRRVGGGFGGKEDQATQWACLAVLGSYLTNLPVKLILHRLDDLILTGRRHPYTSDYKIGVTRDGKIMAYEVNFYQNAGAAADLSPAVLERTLFHATNSYFIPNAKLTATSCKTNLPPNTAFRGFGGPQGMFVIEAAIDAVAKKLGKPTWEVQKLNLIKDEDYFPYGQKAGKSMANIAWDLTMQKYDFSQIIQSVEEYNQLHKLSKKGIAIMPICFGISFTKTSMNQAGALVHIYIDGSVSISTAAVEIGQGVNTRITQVPMEVFSIPAHRVRIETTNTKRVANTSPTAASSTHDLNGKAVAVACETLKTRLFKVTAELLGIEDLTKISFADEKILLDNQPTELTWEKLIFEAFERRVDLSEHGYYATPTINFDMEKEKGKPFAYHTYGTAIIEATVDCLRGTSEINSVKIIHDAGKSLNRIIDLGQIEGGLVQGIGWMTCEELVYNEKGKLMSNSFSTYKIPDIHFTPEIQVDFIPDSVNELGLFKSKAVGEPPLMYGIGAFYAIRNAILAFNQNSSIGYDAPLTHEKTLLGLYNQTK